MKRKAFVTGSTGFLGLNLLEELNKRNWDIIAMQYEHGEIIDLSKFGAVTVTGDINDYDSLVKLIPEEIDAIFHVAGNTSMWSKNNEQQYRDNVLGTQNVVNAALAKKAKKLIYTSSISAYGYHGKKIDESTESNALTCNMNYNKTKFQAEQVVKEASKKGLDAVILNPCNIIGPYDLNGWAKLIKTVYNDELKAMPPGKAMFCHVKDIIDAHINAVDKGAVGENYLLGGPEARFIEVFNEIEKLLGKKKTTSTSSKLKLKFVMHLLMLKSKFDGKEPLITPEKYTRLTGTVSCDYSKAIRDLGYRTSSIQAMITDSYNWLKLNNII